jgi:hypothetical protein
MVSGRSSSSRAFLSAASTMSDAGSMTTLRWLPSLLADPRRSTDLLQVLELDRADVLDHVELVGRGSRELHGRQADDVQHRFLGGADIQPLTRSAWIAASRPISIQFTLELPERVTIRRRAPSLVEIQSALPSILIISIQNARSVNEPKYLCSTPATPGKRAGSG